MKEELSKIKNMLEPKMGEASTEKFINLLESLVLFIPDKDDAMSAFDDFFNLDTLNYISNQKFKRIKVNKWSKDSILEWIEKNGLNKEIKGIYNDNALVVAMNYEYFTHKKFIENMGNAPMTAYNLAIEALEKKGYIQDIFSRYNIIDA